MQSLAAPVTPTPQGSALTGLDADQPTLTTVAPFWDTDQAVPPETRRASLGSRVAPYICPK